MRVDRRVESELRETLDRRPRRRRLVRLGLVLASLLVALVLAEVAVRALGLALPARGKSPAPGRAVPAHEIADVRYLPRPGAVVRGVYPGARGEPERVVEYRINEHGFRDRPYPVRKPAGTFRIAVVGDSFTYGTAIAREETYPYLLERALAARGTARPVEVLNWGVWAYNTLQEAALLEHFAPGLEPDLVLLCAYVNDASGEDRDAPRPAEREPAWELRWIERLGLTSGIWDGDEGMTPARRRARAVRRVSRLADLACHHLHERLAGRAALRHYREDWSEGSPGLAMVRTSLARARAVADREGFRLVGAMYPHLGSLDAHYPHRAAHERMGALCAELELPFVDLFPALEGRDAAALHAHAHDRHPNGVANALVAEYLADALAPYVR